MKKVHDKRWCCCHNQHPGKNDLWQAVHLHFKTSSDLKFCGCQASSKEEIKTFIIFYLLNLNFKIEHLKTILISVCAKVHGITRVKRKKNIFVLFDDEKNFFERPSLVYVYVLHFRIDFRPFLLMHYFCVTG